MAIFQRSLLPLSHPRGKFFLIWALLVSTPLPVFAQPLPRETQTIYLSGTDSEHTVPWEFYCTSGRNSGYWTKIETPSCWEQQGFGHYDYGRDYRTFGKNFRFSDEVGKYRHTFFAPADWKQQTISLVFEGVMTDALVTINGIAAGPVHQGAFYTFQYDITQLLHYGAQNLLEVEVRKMSGNHSVNLAERYADYWVFGGIFRPVYLKVLPASHIHRSALNAAANGQFSAEVFLKGIHENQHLSVEIIDPQGHSVAQQQVLLTSGTEKATIQCQVLNPRCWNAETPHLYTAVLRLHHKKNILHQTKEVFGFRTIDIRAGDGVYINGTKIKFKGVNRHCFWPETGRTLHRRIDRLDVEMIKGMNMNAVRCSHYPPDPSFLELCDSLGLYVLDELAGWQNAYDTESGEKLVREMVERDVNHPSIIFWSNGNEGGTNKALDDDFLLYDPSARPVIHAHHRPGNDYNGIETNHYEKYYSTRQILDGSLIYMPTEFLHAQDDGGAAAGLEDFWELMCQHPRSAGGFIWALLDEGIVRTDLNGAIDVNRVNAPDGILGPHREKEGSYYAIKDIFSPIVLPTTTLPASFDGKLPVYNRYHFTSLDQCRFHLEIQQLPKPWTRSNAPIVHFQTDVQGPAVAAGDSGFIALTLPSDWMSGDILLLQAIDPQGNTVRTWTWPIHQAEQLLMPHLQHLPADTNQVGALNTDSTITLYTPSLHVQFDKKNALLKTIEYTPGLNPLLSNGPFPAQGNIVPTDVQVRQSGTNQVIEASLAGSLTKIRWELAPNGLLRLDYTYTMPADSFPFAGVSFQYPESNILSARWLGNGPYRVWKNRPQGGTLQVWESVYNNSSTGSAPWAYPEFKGYFSDVHWMELRTSEGNILVGSPQPGLFVRLFDFHALSGPIPHPLLPPGDISFLESIPPIGTKLATGLDTNTWELGPMSTWNKNPGALHRTLFFYFGLPRPVPSAHSTR